jgi:aminoglycoside phosphotransferase (APT) family kinase protein
MERVLNIIASMGAQTTEEQLTDPSAGVDLGAIAIWMDGEELETGPLKHVVELRGGTQNVMLRFARGEREFVLRRGPLHLRPRSNDMLRREIRLLTALGTTEVAHPRLIAACLDETVLGGAVFYLMEPIDGFNATTELPALHAGSAEVRHRMGLSVVERLAELGAVDYAAAGLADFGRPEGFLERQVPRWLTELESYRRNDGYAGPDLPDLDRVTNWLEQHRPPSWRPGIMHGDFHVANVMFSRTGPEVEAIVDWEMATIGDPLLDLGYLIATWPDCGGPQHIVDGPLLWAGDLATKDELVRRYGERSDRDMSAIDWYVVLACFKLGVVVEGTHARACAGKAPKAVGDDLHAMALRLFQRATAVAAGVSR